MVSDTDEQDDPTGSSEAGGAWSPPVSLSRGRMAAYTVSQVAVARAVAVGGGLYRRPLSCVASLRLGGGGGGGRFFSTDRGESYSGWGTAPSGPP